jgi:hypothetical protein
MRAEVDVAGVPRAAPPRLRRPRLERLTGRRRLDWFELSVLAAFGAASVWVLALDLYQVLAHGQVWTGTDGVYVVDQMQYLAWIQDASHHFLAGNLFVLHGTPSDYFQPAITVSGVLVALGVPATVALLLWKPVAVIAAFYAYNLYVRRTVHGVWPRRAALVLALFFGSFTLVYGSFGMIGDLFPAFLSWGYTFGLLAAAVMVLAMLAYDRARTRRAGAWLPAVLGALASLLHPWQGELLIMIVIGSELAMWRVTRRAPRLRLPAITVGVTAAPLVYYLVLGHVDQAWQLARLAGSHSFSLWEILLALAPLIAAAVPACRRWPRSFMAAVTRVWLLAALAIFLLSATDLSATPLHAFEGITLPLAVLAVEGIQLTCFRRLPRRRLAGALAVAAVTIPAMWFELRSAQQLVAPWWGNANFIYRGEADALRYLARDPTPGGVLTRFYLGAVVPAETGRRTFVGDCLWSQPNCTLRAQLAQQMLDGTLDPTDTRHVVSQLGARFVLADCNTSRQLPAVLGPLSVSVKRFGCATVYQLRSVSQPTGPLAESTPNAALRASGRQQRRVQSG